MRVRGQNIFDKSTVQDQGSSLSWVVDLSGVERIRDIFKENEDYAFQFFFDANNPSEIMTFRFVTTKPLGLISRDKEILLVKSPGDLASSLSSNQEIRLEPEEIILIISRAFPKSGEHTSWKNVHDGKELTISNIINTEISGGSLLAEPRYAWLANFEDCHQVALRRMTLGHVEAGYCMGGVIRFSNCTNVTIDCCDLFGCGTYGIELISCRNVEIVESTIRDCSYGGVILRDVSGIVFRNCKFIGNDGFDLIQITDAFEDVTFQKCTFEHNKGIGSVFSIEGVESRYGLFIHDCDFKENTYKQISNIPDVVDSHFNRII